MRTVLFVSIILLLGVLTAPAQYFAPVNMSWAFGDSARLDFASGVPVPGASSVNTLEGCASIANSVGELLFYTDGKKVYNRAGTIMPGGSALTPDETYSTTQAAVIVPFPHDTSKYYVFTLAYSLVAVDNIKCKLTYSVIDMALEGGLGDVQPGMAGIFLADTMSEKLITVAGEGCNLWVVAHKADTSLFYVYQVDKDGVSAPTIYDVGLFSAGPSLPLYGNSYCLGTMKCSHDRRSLFLACIQVSSLTNRGTGELYDFDPASGAVSNCRQLSSEALYHAEFSPDNSKLYVHNADSACIFQYDLSLPTLPAIRASKTRLPSAPTAASHGDLRAGPDSKIYFVRSGHTLSCITNPDAAGLACGVVHDAVNLYPHGSGSGLPGLVWKVQGVGTTITGPDTVCAGDSIMLYNAIPGNIWITANSAIATVDATGKVRGINAGATTITYRTENGCFAAKEVTVVNCATGTANIRAVTGIRLYPQPAHEKLVIECDRHATGGRLLICDMAGRELLATPINAPASQVDVSPLAPGIYTCVLMAPAGHTLARTVVVVN